jgi:pyruvate dehydrogenase E2 component (dihydrolipoamide acetyltransferase)
VISFGPLKFSPAARHLVESRSLSTQGLVGTAKGGRISKADVILALQSGQTKPVVTNLKSTITSNTSSASAATAVSTPISATSTSSLIPLHITSSSISYTPSTEPVNDKFEDIPNSNMRKIIAKRLTESKVTVPHFYSSIECEIDSLMSLRKKLKKDFDTNVSVNDLVIKAAACALRDLPRINSKWSVKEGKVMTEGNTLVAISVAVATPNGLITPIVNNADRLGLAEINAKVKDLATRARDGKLKPEEFQGGSYSISNLG